MIDYKKKKIGRAAVGHWQYHTCSSSTSLRFAAALFLIPPDMLGELDYLMS